jgi:hypothetical protein
MSRASRFAAATIAAPPLSPPPGMPFCSPRGSLIIIPPICDEIGYDWPPSSLRR